jgi:DNA-binding ferritin-like protein
MNYREFIPTLRTIAAKSQTIGGEAAKTIQAISNNSPVAKQRCNFVATSALGDPAANFTDDERAAIAEMLADDSDDRTAYTLRVRMSEAERADLHRQAESAEFDDISSYVRFQLFGVR